MNPDQNPTPAVRETPCRPADEPAGILSPADTQQTLFTILNSLPGMVYCCRNDRQWTMIFVSDGCFELTGYRPADLLGNRATAYADLIHPDDREPVWREVQEALAARRRFRLVYRLRTAAGGERWVWEQGHGVFSGAGELLALEGFITDITERKAAEEALRRAELKYRGIFDHSAHGIYQSTPEGRFLNANRALARMLGYDSPAELIASCRSIERDYYADPGTRAELRRVLAESGTVQGFESRVRRRDGRTIWTRENFYEVHDAEGGFLYFEGSVEDVTDRKLAELELRESERRYRELFENANDVVYTHDLGGCFTSLNKTGERVTGYTREEACRMNVADVVAPEYLPLARRMLGRKRDGEESTRYELEITAKDGRRVPLEISTRLVYQDGLPVGVQGIARDITERKQAEEQLRHIAFHDALTGLPNRSLFTDHLRLAVEAANGPGGHLFAVLFLDLDRFTVINDSLGHTVGDRLLVALARRLAGMLRAGDTVARLGGDEFAILLNNLPDPQSALRVAERVQQELKQPFNLSGHEVFATGSIGIALSATGYSKVEDVLRDADTVMYRAKSQGKPYEVFDMVMHARVVAQMTLENDLRRALERGEFCLHYQPIVALDTGRVSGFEALVRWQHPTRGLVAPGEFIPVAEETGLIVPLGLWVLEEACREMRRWHELSPLHAGLKLSVNLSGRQFAQPDLFERVTRVLLDARFDPRCLQLEITESVIVENAKLIDSTMGALRDLGVEIAIDDFGTGYSSLSYLHRFPIHTLKIDRSFISREGANERECDEIVRTIVVLARNMGKDVVAEGVETEQQLARLRQLGCAYGQGYLFSRPRDAAATEALLRAGLESGLFLAPAGDMQAA
jgi:diguanylate cyclase (GGDEF)-like protein/PAS domain S-box-containing protein